MRKVGLSRWEGGEGVHIKLRTCCYGVSTVECVAALPVFEFGIRIVVVDSKVTEVRGNFVEDECYQMATEFQEISLTRCTRHLRNAETPPTQNYFVHAQ